MKWITLVPVNRNDGSKVDPIELQTILDSIWKTFGGSSVEGPITGNWVDPEDGQHYEDRCLRVTVICESSRLSEAEQLVKEIGKQLDQKAMYFEVHMTDDVHIIRTDD